MADIHLDDLANPRLTDIQQMALVMAADHPVTLSVETVLAHAQRRTGLSDFGDDGAKQRLGMWLAEVDGDTNRTALGRAMIYSMCVRNASNRLKLIELWRRHPEIDDVELPEPIIVVGLPRSGTTHLLNLIAADQRLRSLPLWESYDPVPNELVGPNAPPPTHLEVRPDDPRIARVQREWEQSQALLPHQAAMHPMDPHHIHEEIELMSPDFASYGLEWVANVPRWRDYYLSTDQTPHYAFMKKVLQTLQWIRPRSRWILKSPQHFEQLRPLMTVFGDARIVMTHRDPLSVIQSAATMAAYSARVQTHEVRPAEIGAYWADRIYRLLRRAVDDIDVIPAGRRSDVLFGAFMADDEGTLDRIYRAVGLPRDQAAIDAQRRYLANHQRGEHGRLRYDLEGDFGLSADELAERFRFYTERFDVPREVYP